MERIVDGLYRLESSKFVNSYLIEGGSDLTLIDTGHSRAAEKLIAELKSNGFSPKDIGRVVITHAHADHIGGVAALLERHPVKVYAHPEEIPVLNGIKPPAPFKGVKGFFADFAYEHLFPWEPVEAVFPIDAGKSIRGMAQWQVMHVPGHTTGSLAFFNPAKQVLICGDVLSVRGGKPRFPGSAYNGDAKHLRETVKTLAKLDTDILCPGHGSVLRGGAFRYIEALVSRGRAHAD